MVVRLAFVSLSLFVAACSARNLDDYESGTGGSAGNAQGGSAGVGGGGTGNTGNSGGASGSGGGGNTGGGGGTTGGGGSGGSVGGGGSGNTGGGGTTGGGGSGGTPGGGGGSGGTTGGGGSSGGTTGGGGSGGSTGGSGGSGGSTGGSGGSGGTGTTPVCGNSKLESGEQCDDGNKAGGDGCSSNCQVVCSEKFASAVPYTVNGRVHCYWRVGSSNSFPDSSNKCQSSGGHLVTILTGGENAFVLSLCPTSDPRYWIGGTDGQAKSSATQGSYGWVTGESSSYVNWALGQPDWASCGTGCYQHRVTIKSADGKWEDRNESDSEDAICEWEPKP